MGSPQQNYTRSAKADVRARIQNPAVQTRGHSKPILPEIARSEAVPRRLRNAGSHHVSIGAALLFRVNRLFQFGQNGFIVFDERR